MCYLCAQAAGFADSAPAVQGKKSEYRWYREHFGPLTVRPLHNDLVFSVKGPMVTVTNTATFTYHQCLDANGQKDSTQKPLQQIKLDADKLTIDDAFSISILVNTPGKRLISSLDVENIHLNNWEKHINQFESHAMTEDEDKLYKNIDKKTLLQLISVNSSQYVYDPIEQTLIINLSDDMYIYPNELFVVRITNNIFPDNRDLEGFYRDYDPQIPKDVTKTTGKLASDYKPTPPTIISQCQQYGYRKITPSVDQMPAKYCYTTTIIADETYTSMLTNGDIAPGFYITDNNNNIQPQPHRPSQYYVDEMATYCKENNITQPTRRVVLRYHNWSTPMATYLFFFGVGTYATYTREIEYPVSLLSQKQRMIENNTYKNYLSDNNNKINNIEKYVDDEYTILMNNTNEYIKQLQDSNNNNTNIKAIISNIVTKSSSLSSSNNDPDSIYYRTITIQLLVFPTLLKPNDCIDKLNIIHDALMFIYLCCGPLAGQNINERKQVYKLIEKRENIKQQLGLGLYSVVTDVTAIGQHVKSCKCGTACQCTPIQIPSCGKICKCGPSCQCPPGQCQCPEQITEESSCGKNCACGPSCECPPDSCQCPPAPKPCQCKYTSGLNPLQSYLNDRIEYSKNINDDKYLTGEEGCKPVVTYYPDIYTYPSPSTLDNSSILSLYAELHNIRVELSTLMSVWDTPNTIPTVYNGFKLIGPGYEFTDSIYREIAMINSFFGGMENRGNTTIIASRIAPSLYLTDAAYRYMKGVTVHEAYHAQNGSKVTGQSPFEIWLNEAVTVHIQRFQEYLMFGYDVMRIGHYTYAKTPMTGPFAVDKGPSAMAVEPAGFNTTHELITAMTYSKAPEVTKMVERLIGTPQFFQGLDLYYRRFAHGNATSDDWIQAMVDISNDNDIKDMLYKWLKRSNHPHVQYTGIYNKDKQQYTIYMKQSGYEHFDGHSITIQDKVIDLSGPWRFPVEIALLDSNGNDLLPHTHSSCITAQSQCNEVYVHDLKTVSDCVTFDNITVEPVGISFNRGWSYFGTHEYITPYEYGNNIDTTCYTHIQNDNTPNDNRNAKITYATKMVTIDNDPINKMEWYNQAVCDEKIDLIQKIITLSQKDNSDRNIPKYTLSSDFIRLFGNIAFDKTLSYSARHSIVSISSSNAPKPLYDSEFSSIENLSVVIKQGLFNVYHNEIINMINELNTSYVNNIPMNNGLDQRPYLSMLLGIVTTCVLRQNVLDLDKEQLQVYNNAILSIAPSIFDWAEISLFGKPITKNIHDYTLPDEIDFNDTQTTMSAKMTGLVLAYTIGAHYYTLVSNDTPLTDGVYTNGQFTIKQQYTSNDVIINEPIISLPLLSSSIDIDALQQLPGLPSDIVINKDIYNIDLKCEYQHIGINISESIKSPIDTILSPQRWLSFLSIIHHLFIQHPDALEQFIMFVPSVNAPYIMTYIQYILNAKWFQPELSGHGRGITRAWSTQPHRSLSTLTGRLFTAQVFVYIGRISQMSAAAFVSMFNTMVQNELDNKTTTNSRNNPQSIKHILVWSQKQLDPQEHQSLYNNLNILIKKFE